MSFIVIDSQVQTHVRHTCIQEEHSASLFGVEILQEKFHIFDSGKLRHVNLDAQK